MMKKLLLSLLIFSIGCKSSKFDNEVIPKILKEEKFLLNEWWLDSIENVPKEGIVYESLYFEKNHNFWKFCTSNEDYLIDSCGKFDSKSISVKNRHKYDIIKITPNEIILVDLRGEKKFYKKEIYSFIDDIKTVVNDRAINLKLLGEWYLEKSEIIPISIPSFCDYLFLQSKFIFKDGKMTVLPNNKKRECYSYSYHISENRLSFLEIDMLMEFEIMSINTNSLVLKSHYPPEIRANDTLDMKMYSKVLENGYIFNLRKK